MSRDGLLSMAGKAFESSAVVGSGIAGAIIAAVAMIIVGWMKLRGTFLGHLIGRNEHLEKLLREDRRTHEEDMAALRDYYEARIESICRKHEQQMTEIRQYYDREISAVRKELHDLREQVNHHDSER